MILVNLKTNPLKVTSLIAIVSIFFPYVALIKSDSDTQPYAFIFNSVFIFIYIFSKKIVFSKKLLIYYLLFLYSVFLSVSLESYNIRSIFGYASIALITTSVYLIVKDSLINYKLISIYVFIWFLFGLIQTFYNRDFGSILLPRMTTGTTRGVVGLAPEPSYYGISCIFMFVVLRIYICKNLIDHKMALFLEVILIFQILFLAQSSIAILMLILYLLIKLIISFNFKMLFYSLVFLFFCYLIIDNSLSESRVFSLVRLVFSEPKYIYIVDASINDRFGQIYISLLGFIKSFPVAIGHGTNSWEDYLINNLYSYPDFYGVSITDRIMSGFGGGLFELGLAGILLPFLSILIFFRHHEKEMKVLGVFVFICLFAAIPLAFPLYSFLLGLVEALRVLEKKKLSLSLEMRV